MIDPHALRRLAVLNVIGEKIAKEVRAVKTEIGTALGRGSMTAFATPGDPNSEILGVLTMSKPRQGAPRIVDEQAAMVWLLDNFPNEDGLVEARLSDRGRKALIAAVSGGGEVPGVEIPAPGKPVASFKQTAEAESQIEAMLERGEIRLFEDVFAEAVQQ
ncbi:hypothetical protein [Gordonia sp. MMO-8]|uniref:hypothetical protein n=1 Tax=Gordonia sp. MMO-8 TaxID=3127886 RepID=UPI003017E9AE